MYDGRSWRRSELLSWVGSVEQVAGARRSLLAGGKSEGVEAVEVWTGGGLRFTLLPGRGMDIGQASFRETPLAFYSGTGVTSPAYYEEPGLGWLRGFYGGLLTTCGLTTAGAPSVDEGTALGLHGRVANAAAEDVCIERCWEGDEYRISVRGTVREAAAMFENLRLTRTVTTWLGSSRLAIHDVVENLGFEAQPLMLLYHFNFGWPLLGTGSRVVAPVTRTTPRDAEAARDRGVEEAFVFPEPRSGYAEKVFFHTLGVGGDGRTCVALLNPSCAGRPLGMLMRFRPSQLGSFTQWKMPRRGFYVLGLEPGTTLPVGRAQARASGQLRMLEGMARHDVEIELEVIEGTGALGEAEKAVSAIPR